ncbi:unnamed protein product [Adineta steineri]|uniref:Smr domain-containing protein n=1 Tax=Adineta steineri TaxID=433720 RepID=A0A814X8K8_9BILA|nr:unnamed protein product [Adineta steineri]CAF1210801.1 unnamed protein product [Adineta steineri]
MGNLFSSGNEGGNSVLSKNAEAYVQNGIPIEAVSLRCEAFRLMNEAKEASRHSQLEYQSGNKSQAKLLSINKNNLYIRMNEKNQQAAELIFKHFNQNRSNEVIDLHGLYVTEALKYVEDGLNRCRLENLSQLTIITGIGNNSPNKIPKIKPQVEEFVRRNNLKVTYYDGHIVIDLSINDENKTINDRNSNECIIL